MARKAAKRLTPKGVLALKKEGYHADSEAVGLYVQVAYRQKAGKLDRKHGVSRSWIYRFTSPVTKRCDGWARQLRRDSPGRGSRPRQARA